LLAPLIHKVIECVLKRAWEELTLQVNGKETRAGVDVFVARHAVGVIAKSMR